MAIRISRNEAGNCITFEGSSNPVYWNACLSGEVDPSDNTLINVVNDIITAQRGETEYEFYRIPFTEFVDKEGNAFVDAQATADYITVNANVIGLSGDGIDLIGQTVCFSLDATSTSIMLDTGHSFGVNTIKAVVDSSGTIKIISNNSEGSITHFFNLEVGNACKDDGSIIPGGLNDVEHYLNELFTVGAFEAVVISDPFSTLIANVGGEPAGYTEEGTNFQNPIGDAIATNLVSNNSQAGIKSIATISRPGEYFTFDIQGKSTYGFGLVHTTESYDSELYSGNATYADPATFCVTNSQHSGFQFSHWFHIGNAHASWTNYGANTSYVQGAAWTNNVAYFEEKDDWNNNNPVTVKVGLDAGGYIEISTKKDDGTFVLHARSNYKAEDGAEFHLGVKVYYPSASVLSAPKVHLIDHVQAPTTLGTDAITVFGENISGTLAGGITANPTDSLDNDGFVTTQTINEVGEYFEFTWSAGGDANFGLFSENDHDVADLIADTGQWSNDDYIFYGARAESNGTMTNEFIEGGEANTVIGNAGDNLLSQYYGRVGFDGQGRATVWYSVDGTNWTVFHHAQASAPAGDYKFIWVANDDNAVLDTLQQGVIDTAPTLNFRYVESPDGVFQYPIFGTLEEANYFIEQNGGTANSGTTQIFPDDPTNAVWFLPYPYYNPEMPEAPSGETFLGNVVNYTEITTLTNADLTPPAFTDTTITVNELSQVNYQLAPQDVDYVTSIGGIPNWEVVDGYLLQGLAPEVTGDNVTNPSDTTTVTVYRTKNGLTSQGTLTIVITNLTAPVVTPITGFTHDATSDALADTDIMASGSVVSVDETLDDNKRFIILKEYVATNILPALQQEGDKYFIGVLNSGADVVDVDESDFDVAFVWEYQTTTSHKYKVIKDGVQQWSVGIGSRTNGFYDYAIETHDNHVHMIACNEDAINTEPSTDFGGSFSNATEVALDETLPATISMAYVGSQTAAFSTGSLSEIVTPAPDNWIQVTESGNILSFDGSTTFPTLQAGYTYRLLMGEHIWADQVTDTHIQLGEIVKFTADGTTEYDMGGSWTQVGTEGTNGSYIEFTVPSDVPPLHWYGSAAHNPINLDASNAIAINGSTYVVPVTGVTQEGPSANFTGNVINAGSNGWLSLNEQLSAGERLVINSTFIEDLNSVLPDHCIFWIGLKDDAWTNTGTPTSAFKGGAAVRFYNTTGTEDGLRIFAYAGGGTSPTQSYISASSLNGTNAFIEITSSGNNIRVGFNNGGSSNDASSTTYADWTTDKKVQTGDQGYGINSIDVVIYWYALPENTVGFDISSLGWTALTEVNVPTPPITNLTSWTKALDFSGASERAQQVGTSGNYMPIAMDGLSASNTTAPAVSGNTSGGVYSRPWACAVVFKIDGNNSNQHIWNQGEGAGSTDDNIYLRLDAAQNLYFGWGRDGALNECRIQTAISSGFWYAVYIGHDGRRWQSAGATAGNLYTSFDIRLMSGHDNFNAIYDVGTFNDWNHASSTTGGRMDRSVVGNFTIGGRGSNRNFHGKIASMVATTLRINQPMPTDAEIKTMITDPLKWINDYKDGQTYRVASSQAEATFVAYDYLSNSAFSTQVWLMGDGNLDNYSNMIRNQIYPNDQNYTKLNMLSMVSNDIQTVTIGGLTT